MKDHVIKVVSIEKGCEIAAKGQGGVYGADSNRDRFGRPRFERLARPVVPGKVGNTFGSRPQIGRNVNV